MKKKTLAVLAALLILLAPLCASAENSDAVEACPPEVQSQLETADGSITENAEIPDNAEIPEAAEPVPEGESAGEPSPAKGDQPLSFGESLGYMLKGMAGIFLVTAIIILAVVLLEKAGGKKKDGQA